MILPPLVVVAWQVGHILGFVRARTFAFTPALAQADAAPVDGTFGLGQIIVTGKRAPDVAIGTDSVGQEAIYRFDRRTLDDAANLIPGVTAGNSGGSRNERLLFVRGFDRFQVPLSIDGIRVYLPADNVYLAPGGYTALSETLDALTAALSE